MNVAEIVVVAFALAVDATVYSFSYGLILRERRLRSSVVLALVVGLFQAGMPLIGYLGGLKVRDAVAAWDHWIVLVVFGLLGGSIIRQAWCGDEEDCDASSPSPLGLAALLLVGVATSIDALAVGACMALGSIGGSNLSPLELGLAVSLIGGVTFACSLSAFHAARPLQKLPTRWLETFAGLLLIGLGAQNLLRELL